MDDAGVPDALESTTSEAANGDVDMNGSEEPAPQVKKEVKLEDLFADVDSDEEFPSSAPVKDAPSSSPQRAASPM